MIRYVALEVDRGNIRRGGRLTASDLCTGWNVALRQFTSGVLISPAFRHTGNYIVRDDATNRSLADITALLKERLGRRFALFEGSEFISWVGELRTALGAPPAVSVDRRPTPGAVMDLDPVGDVPPVPSSTKSIVFSSFARCRVRGAWKLDALRQDRRVLDARRREGGWGAVSLAMSAVAGGIWTARALSTLAGVVDAARHSQ
jgi:hypothetical protein